MFTMCCSTVLIHHRNDCLLMTSAQMKTTKVMLYRTVPFRKSYRLEFELVGWNVLRDVQNSSMRGNVKFIIRTKIRCYLVEITVAFCEVGVQQIITHLV